MKILDSWFKYNQRQIEIQNEIEKVLQKFIDNNIILNEFYLLHFLNEAENKKLKQIELQDKLLLSISAISRMISKLEDKGCGVITRCICNDDKRAAYIMLTEHGQDIYNKAYSVVSEVLNKYKEYF